MSQKFNQNSSNKLMPSTKEIFISELVKQRGIQTKTAIRIFEMEPGLRHEVLVALRDSYLKGKN